MKNIILAILFCNLIVFAQVDETKYQWPTPPLNSSQGLNATFGEFRNTGSSDHFHNAVDIGEPDGNPVYPSMDGTVYSFVNNGYDSYLNVKSLINGKKKHFTYYHVVPSPSLTVGQNVVTGQTILGTIYVGAAHVHLIERELLDENTSGIGNEINPVRPEGGLNPYTDFFPPVIEANTLRFFQDRSSIDIPSNQLKGKVDIRIKVREVNGATGSNANNGTYILGYRILSEDGNQIIYEPADNGVKYRFYFLPSDGYVHSAYAQGVATLSDPIYWLTNGNGENQINSTLTIPNNYLDTDLLDEGNYLLEIFSEDTRGNSASTRFPISVIKLPPVLSTVLTSNDSIFISWENYVSINLKGYRMYYSPLLEDDWKLAADETTLTSETTEIMFKSPNNFLTPTTKKELKYYLTAIDSNENESERSDIYSTVSKLEKPLALEKSHILIVDGFDRYGGNASWAEPTHEFNLVYAKSIYNTLFYFDLSSCSNEAVIDELINLNDYSIVIWFLGDESIVDNTLVNIEQFKIAQYLENGGKLFISGSNIGQDLDTKHSYSEFSDTLFYHQYLKAKLMHDGIDLLNEIHGEEGSIFEGFETTFYDKAPDDIEPINGAVPILNYNFEHDRDGEHRKGGIAYKGTFGDSSYFGQLFYFSFPFESITDENGRNQLMLDIFLYYNIIIIGVDEENNISPNKFVLEQNYPNPFNPITTIKYSIPSVAKENFSSLKLTVYDILGREVKTLVNENKKPGTYEITFDASNLASGIYYYQIKTDSFIQTKKMILLK
ncbi:MAG: T9SS type A sorting domain-containing protein [Ignavibacteriae bacterium]|nr:T9SS type A sorting domain-containing protein [Ignavibacteriota bacterium]